MSKKPMKENGSKLHLRVSMHAVRCVIRMDFVRSRDLRVPSSCAKFGFARLRNFCSAFCQNVPCLCDQPLPQMTQCKRVIMLYAPAGTRCCAPTVSDWSRDNDVITADHSTTRIHRYNGFLVVYMNVGVKDSI